tara:strand:- start:1584 stop:1934 length:351 start_codon:yes stop_codon:yes gene_type:complete
MSKNNSRKKCIKIYRKTVIAITYKLLKGTNEVEEIRTAGGIVTDMINSFTDYLFSFQDEVMTESEQEHLTNIVNEYLLKISGKVDSYIPEREDVLYVAMKLGKMIIKTNKIIADNE